MQDGQTKKEEEEEGKVRYTRKKEKEKWM